MSIPFYRGGFALPVAQALRALLNQEVAKRSLDLMQLTELTFSFTRKTRDSSRVPEVLEAAPGKAQRPACASIPHSSPMHRATSGTWVIVTEQTRSTLSRYD